MRRPLLIGILAIGMTAVVAVVATHHGSGLPAEIRLEDVVADLSGSLDRQAVLTENAEAPVRAGDLAPNPYLKKWGGRRHALIAPPPSRLRFRLRLPADAALELSPGIESPGHLRAAAGVRFSVRVDGRERLSRTINPTASRHDRRWFDERVELAAPVEREVEIELATEAAGSGQLAGTPGWSHVRVLRETRVARQAARPAAPNVLVLLVDTLRADRLGCYGARPGASPTLDRLADGGLVFENAVAQSSWTLPSVATLFTGLHPRSHGVVGESPEASFLSDALPTLAGEAERAGITTVGVSGNFLVSRGTNFARGFETFLELPEDRDSREEASAANINAAFLAWLRRHPGHRFLAYLHYMEPHEPYTPPPALRPAAPAGLGADVASGHVKDLTLQISHGKHPPLDAPAVHHLLALYDGEIRGWDAELARLLDGLSAIGVRESTIIVVTADHGEEFQEHGRLGHGTQLYDELLRVPLVISGPTLPRGRVAVQAQGVDLFPTLAALLGLQPPRSLPGQNLLARDGPRPAVSETHGAIGPDGADIPLLSFRTTEWKLIHAPTLGRYELYNLRRDAAEREDVFATSSEGPALAQALAAWEAEAPPPPMVTDSDPALHKKLRALGYVE